MDRRIYIYLSIYLYASIFPTPPKETYYTELIHMIIGGWWAPRSARWVGKLQMQELVQFPSESDGLRTRRANASIAVQQPATQDPRNSTFQFESKARLTSSFIP